MSMRMLLTPQHEQQRRWFNRRAHCLRPKHLGVAALTKSNHQVQLRNTQHSMVNARVEPVAHPTPVSVAAQNSPQPAKLSLVLMLQRVAGSAQTQGKNVWPTAWTTERAFIRPTLRA